VWIYEQPKLERDGGLFERKKTIHFAFVRMKTKHVIGIRVNWIDGKGSIDVTIELVLMWSPW